jgi:ABC-2 type transport system ATP-binding protein
MNSSQVVASLRGVGKRYGRRHALRQVDLTISAGEIVGFIGPNGAGKTTLIKLMAGLSRASEGEIIILGQDMRHRAVTPDGIGLVVEQPSFVPYLSGMRNLELLASIRGVAEREAIVAALAAVGLKPEDRRPTRAYSQGMRQRLGLAQALMEGPRFLLLDEPTNGLDPAGVIELRGMLRELADTGTAIFMASHLLTEVERICDRVLLVNSGQILKHILCGAQADALEVALASDADLVPFGQWARTTGVVAEPVTSANGALVRRVVLNRPASQVIRELVMAGVNLNEVRRGSRSLEEEFMTMLGGPVR